MPPHVSVEQLKESIGDKRLRLATITDSREFFEKRISAAWAEIYSRIGVWYKLPLNYGSITDEQRSEVENLLELWCIAIAAHSIFSLSTAGVPKEIQIAYDRTMSRLRDIHDLTYRLPYIELQQKRHIAIIGDRANEITPEIFTLSRMVD